MRLDAITEQWLLYHLPMGFPVWLNWVNVLLIAIIFIATLLWSIPNHQQLREFDSHSDVIDRLVRGNWVRTLVWTVRLDLLGFVALRGYVSQNT